MRSATTTASSLCGRATALRSWRLILRPGQPGSETGGNLSGCTVTGFIARWMPSLPMWPPILAGGRSVVQRMGMPTAWRGFGPCRLSFICVRFTVLPTPWLPMPVNWVDLLQALLSLNLMSVFFQADFLAAFRDTPRGYGRLDRGVAAAGLRRLAGRHAEQAPADLVGPRCEGGQDHGVDSDGSAAARRCQHGVCDPGFLDLRPCRDVSAIQGCRAGSATALLRTASAEVRVDIGSTALDCRTAEQQHRRDQQPASAGRAAWSGPPKRRSASRLRWRGCSKLAASRPC